MADSPADTQAAAEAATRAAQAAETPPAVTPAPADGDPFDNGQQTFSRDYVQSLRHESAGYRTKLREYEAPFSSYSDDERATWFQLAHTLAVDPEAGAKAMKQIADGILTPEEAAAEAAAGGQTPPPAGEAPAYVTPDQLNAALAERERASAQAAEVGRIQAEARGLGYEPGSKAYFELLFVANQTPGNDLKAAHDAIAEDKQKVIAEYLEQKRKDASGNISPVAGGGPPGEEKPVLSFADAKASLEARLSQLP